jgi:hypothetical protein
MNTARAWPVVDDSWFWPIKSRECNPYDGSSISAQLPTAKENKKY